MSSRDLVASLRGLAGGIVGGIAGFFLYKWLIGYGLYGPMIPGTLLGLGWGLASRHRSHVDGAIAAILALILGVFSAWQTVFLGDDKSLVTFLAHLTTRLSPPMIIMILIGGAMGYWLGMGRSSKN